jgi:hypothetical protein
MTLQLDTITVIPFLLAHLSQFGLNGSHVKATPSGWRAQSTRASLDSARPAAGLWPPPGRKTGWGKGRATRVAVRSSVALPLVAAQLPTVRSRAASLHQPGEADA